MTAKQVNPLLVPSDLPYEAIPFDKIRPKHFLPAVRAAINEARKNIAAIRDNPAPPSFQNTIEALEFADEKLAHVAGVFTAISAVNASEKMMDIEPAISAKLTDFDSEVMTDDILFARVQAVYDVRDRLPLDAEQRMLLERTYKEFADNGALLDEEGREELREIDQQIAEITETFLNNVVKSIGRYKKIISDEEELAGIPERTKAIYKEAAQKKGHRGKWLIELSPPPHDIMLYCDNRDLRREIYAAQNSIACSGRDDNREVLIDMVGLRHRRAQLLGYENYAQMALQDRLAKTPEEVMGFLSRMSAIYKPAAEKHLQRVKNFALAEDGLMDFEVWDYKYYNRRLQEREFQIDMEVLRPYFDLTKVFDGLRLHAEKLFGIEIVEVKDTYPVYHPDVKAYEVTDKKTGETLGVMYTDYYARPGEKNAGSWMEAFRERGLYSGEDKCPIIINVCDFAKPAEDAPTLLSPEEVRTLFHEFGHGLHSLLARGKYPSQNGTNVERDYMELPSQLQEEWVRQAEVLATFAQHYQTGEALSPTLIKAMLEFEKFNAAYNGAYMNFLSMLDMTWYTTDPDEIESVEALEDKVTDKYFLFPRGVGSVSANFDHLVDYAAAFYSYDMDAVLDADIFEEFKERGLYDPALGQRLRDIIYAKGSTVDGLELFMAMRGRVPKIDALLKRDGLLPPDDRRNPLPPPAP